MAAIVASSALTLAESSTRATPEGGRLAHEESEPEEVQGVYLPLIPPNLPLVHVGAPISVRGGQPASDGEGG